MRRRIIAASGAVIMAALVILFLVAGATKPEGQSPSPPSSVPATASLNEDTATQSAPERPTREPVLVFKRLLMDTSGVAPDACLRFSEPLDQRPEAHYRDYLHIDPAVTPALRIAGADLCLGGLVYGTTYKVMLLKGLPAQAGSRLAADEMVEVSLGDRLPVVALSGDGFILPRGASNGLTVQTVNVDRVTVRVLRMSDRLLPNAIRRPAGWRETQALTGKQISRYQLREMLKGSATLVWSGSMTIERDHNRNVQTAFPLAQIIKPGQIGAYLVIAENSATATPERLFTDLKPQDDDRYDELWVDVPAHWVIATDIALSTMSGVDGLHVFARSLVSADPLADVKLSLVAAGQDVLGEATTDADGQAVFAPGLLHGKGANAAASITAYGAGGDFTLLDLNHPAFDLSDRGVTGRPVAGPIEAFLYTERGIYRPGDTVPVMALLRDGAGRAIDTLPITLLLRRPDGLEAKRFTLAAAAQGGFRQDVGLSRSAARGVWSIEALVDPTGAPVGRVQFEVQDFVPQKLKVTLSSTAAMLRPGEPLDVTLAGQFLYGAPAAGLAGEAELRIMRDPSPVPQAKGYRFGLADEKVDDAVQKLTLAPADAAGHSRISDVLQPVAASSAPLKAVLSAGLFEPGGRLVSDQLELPIRQQPLLIGIKPRFAGDRVEEDKDATFDVLVFDGSLHAAARPGLQWRLVRENRVYDWVRSGSDWTWHYHVVDQPLASGEVDVPAGGPAVLSQAVGWGYYRLVLDDPATGAATSVRFQSGWMATTESADTPDRVEVTAEKPLLEPGETARLRIQGPSAGKAQVTIASDRIFETRQVAIAKEGTVIEVKASEAWGAGAYVLVSLYRPLADGRPHDPVRAVGLAWLGIDPRPHTLSVALATPEKVVPRQRLAVPIKVEGALGQGETFVSLAAVDEGVLQLTRYATPDPAKFFFGRRRLGVELRDDYGRLLDGSAARGAIREGGDAAAPSLGGEGLAVVSNRTVALFSGPVRLDASGAGEIALDIPDFVGQLRLMAVAYNRDAVGHGESRLIVRDPVVAELSLPRFLAPGDTAHLALTLHNVEGEAGEYRLALAAGGAARVGADHPLRYTLAPGARKLDRVEIEGLDEGIGTIAADLSGPGGYTLHREWQIAVRAAQYPIALEETAIQSAGEPFRIDADKLKPFIRGSVSVSLDYSGFAGIDVPSLLQSLYRYPYGCTEQLSASAFPLVYFNDPALLGPVPRDAGVTRRVQEAIGTILDRQDAEGQFGLWRAGDGDASPWLNVYAIDFLMHAKEAGFIVPDAALSRSYAWVSRAVRHIGESNDGAYANAPDATRAYAAYVLARAGRADIGDLRRMRDTAQWAVLSDGTVAPASVHWNRGRSDDSIASPLSLGHLAGALSLMGDHARAHSAFALALANLELRHYPSWWFHRIYYSDTRDIAGLAAIAAESGDAQTAATLLDRLGGRSLSAEHLNTQEKASLLAAAHALSTDVRARSLSVNGKEISQLKLPAALAPSLAEIERGYETVNTGERPLWRTLVIRGAPRQAPSAMEQGYWLGRRYFRLDGTPVDPAHLVQNDRIIVSLTGRAEDGNAHRSVLVDMLPAGWEIEAIVAREQEYAFLGPLTRPQIAEMRDDRFVAAFDLGDVGQGGRQRRWRYTEHNDAEPQLASDEFSLAYIVRVVTPGHFALPAAVVEDMYRPGVMARTDAGATTADAR